MRCARLLAELGVTDRSGDGRIFEVYPAAALAAWSLRPKQTYKGKKGRAFLPLLVDSLCRAARWVEFASATPRNALTSDHFLDALVAALNVRAAMFGLTHRPPPEHAELAKKGGWIALPREGTLAQLGI